MKHAILLITISLLTACTKKLDLKPNTGIVLPKTVKEYESMLDNTEVINITPALNQLSADEYFITSQQNWQTLPQITARNAYIWQTDIYGGENKIVDWTRSYSAIFYANNVLDLLAEQDISNDSEKQRVKGWALFIRSYHFYVLLSTFAKAYDASYATTSMGIPIRLSAGIDEVMQRSTLQQSYDQVLKDALAAAELLNVHIPAGKRNRPSKVAAFAFLSRVYLSMRNYELAEKYADQALTLYPTLTDFNTLSTTSANAFSYNSEEIIFFSQQNNLYSQISYRPSTIYGIDSTLINLYDPEDLRLSIYYQKNTAGNYNIKPINNGAIFPFTGLATDELYLIKAECLARNNQRDEALGFLNELLKNRIETGSFDNIVASDSDEALEKILTERRKALVWRSLRWTDLKRLNLEGKNISLSRTLGDQVYTLEPNSPKYVLPIPDDEIALSGIAQNIR